MSRDDDTLDACGCCAAPEAPAIDNRPGLPALSYRVGTWSTFMEAMRERLAARGPLEQLTTRAPDDPTMAICDAWAVIGDILTFYQERIANEGYLRTATERRSVLELARSVGYELGPGVAAATYLAFIVDEALIEGAGLPLPPSITLRAGTRVQSVPGHDELPQSFETVEEIEARSAWNVMKPKTMQRQRLQIRGGALERIDPATGDGAVAQSIWLAGTTSNLHHGDVILIRIDDEHHKENDSVTPTDGLLCLYVTKVKPDYDNKRTRVDLAQAYPEATPIFSLPPQPAGVVDPTVLPFTPENVRLTIMERDWVDEELAAFLEAQAWDADDVLKQVTALLEDDPPPAEIQAFRHRTGAFGHSAPPYAGIEHAYELKDKKPPWKDWDRGLSIWTNSDGKSYASAYAGVDVFLDRLVHGVVPGTWLALAGPRASTTVPKLSKSALAIKTASTAAAKKVSKVVKPAKSAKATKMGKKNLAPAVVSKFLLALSPPPSPTPYLVDRVVEMSLSDFAMSSKATGVHLLDPKQSPPKSLSAADKPSSIGMRTTTIFSDTDPLDPGEAPIEEPIFADGEAASLVLDRMVLGLQKGQKVAWTGVPIDPVTRKRAGRARSEILTVEYALHRRGYTTVVFAEPLEYCYRRSTVTLNANVAPATHGETIARELLGSGDGSQRHQSFTLKAAPLTYVPAQTPSGSETTLIVRVGGVAWTEVPTLYPAGPKDRVYTVRHQHDGSTQVEFGDGKRGARLPTGRENVVATYRKGTGPQGHVKAGSISILQTRPLGLKSALNPIRASGAEAPEELRNARANAPRTVRTLDRLVSLADYEDFARGFAGVGKVQASPLWSGERQIVHLTVGSATGGPIPTTSDLLDNLAAAVLGASDGRRSVMAARYERRFFRLTATLTIDPRRNLKLVLGAARKALRAAFSYRERAFAQPVTDAEIMKAAHAVPGVIAIDVDLLYYAELPASLAGVLPAAGARFDGGVVRAAELLLLHPAGLLLSGVNP